MRLGLRGRASRSARILFATDLHGSEVVFRKFLNAVGIYEADVAILGGDLTGKRIAPVVEEDGRFVARLLGVEETAEGDAVDELEARIRNLGQYPVRMSAREYDELTRDEGAVHERFLTACTKQVADWMERAAERLAPRGVPLFVTGGNDDYFEIEAVLDEASHVTNAEGRVVEIVPGVEMMSTGYGNPTPWQCPRDIPEDELAEKIAAMASSLRDPERAVFNLHVPPYGSGLDFCPRLDTSVDPPKPVVGEDVPAGSTAVRGAIERFRPQLALHGHIHESPGIRELGRTICVNPGSEYGEGVLRSAVIDLADDGSVLSTQLLAA